LCHIKTGECLLKIFRSEGEMQEKQLKNIVNKRELKNRQKTRQVGLYNNKEMMVKIFRREGRMLEKQLKVIVSEKRSKIDQKLARLCPITMEK
jgi:hypothetical protein